MQLFKYKFNLETVIGVIFKMLDNVDYTVEWMLLTFENEYDEHFEKLLDEEKLWSNIKELKIY